MATTLIRCSSLRVAAARCPGHSPLLLSARCLSVLPPKLGAHPSHHLPISERLHSALRQGTSLLSLMYTGTRDLYQETSHSLKLYQRPLNELSRRDYVALNSTFITDKLQRMVSGSVGEQRALSKHLIDEITAVVSDSTAMPDDGIENKVRAQWVNLLTMFASPDGVLYDHLATPALFSIVSNVWKLENVPSEQQQLCAKLMGQPAIMFPGRKISHHLDFLLQDDRKIRKENVAKLTDKEVYNALVDRGYLRSCLDDKSIPERRHLLERWVSFTSHLNDETKSAMIVARALNAK